MKVFVVVKPGSKSVKFEKVDETHFKAGVKSPPKENKANAELIRLAAKYFKVTQNSIQIVSGQKNLNKVLMVYL
jgi:uncharacterized protein (TIGR00251 family)